MNTDPRMTKLPQWAQQHIKNLEGSLKFYQDELAGRQDERTSDTFAAVTHDLETPLGTSTRIRFKMGPDEFDYIEARIEYIMKIGAPELIVSSGRGTIVIHPQSGNVFRTTIKN